VAGWDMTHAIGFFNLPNPNQVEQESHEIIDCIDRWIDSICSDDDVPEGNDGINSRSKYDYRVLVDIFFGVEFPVADDFLDCWKERKIISEHCDEVAYFSSARPPAKKRHDLPYFSKSKVDELGELYHDFKTWLGYVPVQLEKVWENSKGWFDVDRSDGKSDIVSHDFARIRPHFEEGSPKAIKYRQEIEKGVDIKFPEAWWQDLDALQNIHESLKHFCGEVFCGSTKANGRRNISVGAAYLIALKAHQDIYGDLGALADDSHMWQTASRATSRIFPLQEPGKAKSSAIYLYEFFFNVFSRHEITGYSSPVKTAYFDQGGEVLKIQLKWKAHERPSNRPKSLAQQLAERFDSDQIDAPDPEDYDISRNTKDAISRLWRSMMFNDYGFLSPGVIYMERDEVVVASTEYLVQRGGRWDA
jgi:hypothetical protein